MNNELMEATRRLLDLKLEKKEFNKTQNERIKENEARIKELCKEDVK
jgi:hypothetical protein